MKNVFNIKSYLIFLGRNKLYAFITIFGFAVALMFVILTAIYARDQFTTDSFHVNKDRISLLYYEDHGAVAIMVASLTVFWQAYKAMMIPAAKALEK